MTPSSSTQAHALDPLTPELLRCPLCDCAVDMTVSPWRGFGPNLAPQVACPSCGLELWGSPVHGMNITEQVEQAKTALATAWNRRATVSSAVPVAFVVHDDPELGDYLTKSRQAADASGKRVTPLYAQPLQNPQQLDRAAIPRPAFDLLDDEQIGRWSRGLGLADEHPSVRAMAHEIEHYRALIGGANGS